jgi:hypothetical protein
MPYMNKTGKVSKKITKASEKAKLEQFNTEMGAKIKLCSSPNRLKSIPIASMRILQH